MAKSLEAAIREFGTSAGHYGKQLTEEKAREDLNRQNEPGTAQRVAEVHRPLVPVLRKNER